jgi:hypothetical protein
MKDAAVNAPIATGKIFDLNKCFITAFSYQYVLFGTALLGEMQWQLPTAHPKNMIYFKNTSHS